jgi:hypothetical protein
VGQFILSEMEKPEAQKKFEAFQAIFSFDPRRELHGATLYGASKAEEDGVLLIYADFDAARLTTLAEGAKDHKSSMHGSHTIHHWIDEKKKAKDGVQPRTYAAIHGKVVIFAQKERRVIEALEVMDRARPNLGANAEFAGLDSGSAFLRGAARKMSMPEGDPNAAVFKQAKMITLTVGEANRKLEAALALQTDSEEVARSIEAVGRGLIGLMSLQKDKPESQKFAQGLAVEQTGTAVTVKLSLPADDAIGMLKAAEAKKQAAKKPE